MKAEDPINDLAVAADFLVPVTCWPEVGSAVPGLAPSVTLNAAVSALTASLLVSGARDKDKA